MSDCLVYWKYYWDDVQIYGYTLLTYHWNTRDESFFTKVEPGDSLWVIIAGGSDYPSEWRLLEKLVVRSLTIDHNHKYGKYQAMGDIARSEFYSLDHQKDLTPKLHSLQFQSGKEIPKLIRERNIGNYLQSIRPISTDDISALHDYSKTIPRLAYFTPDLVSEKESGKASELRG